MFKSLELSGWRQFASVEVEFHNRLTVLTGANGAGKTTIIHLLNRHWGWDIPYVSSPRGKGKKRKYWTGFWSSKEFESQAAIPRGHLKIGSLVYSNDQTAILSIPEAADSTFRVQITGQQDTKGVYVSSHRPLYLPHTVDSIPTKLDIRGQIFQNYWNELRRRYNPTSRVASASYQLKQALISLATFGFGNDAVTPDPEAHEVYTGFERILRLILPSSLGFQRLVINMPDVVLATRTGNFSLDAVSGGIAAMIDIAWQIHLYSQLEDEYVVAIDEPEAHLHPELQHIILPRLLEAFPKAQFIVATHNPFVVGSVRNSNVYALVYDNDRRVRSAYLEEIDKSGTSNDILREVLGVESISAEWVEALFESIVRQYLDEAGQADIGELRKNLEAAGLGRYIPDGLLWISKQQKGEQ